jgi:hypothetical protein
VLSGWAAGVFAGIEGLCRDRFFSFLLNTTWAVFFPCLLFFIRKGSVLELVSYSVVSVLICHAFIPLLVYLSVRCSSPAAIFTTPLHLVFFVRPWPQRLFFSSLLLLFVWKIHVLLLISR